MTHLWTLPTLITLAVVAWAAFTPLPASQYDYGFGAAFAILGRGIVAVIVTLGVWLAYFAAMYFGGGA